MCMRLVTMPPVCGICLSSVVPPYCCGIRLLLHCCVSLRLYAATLQFFAYIVLPIRTCSKCSRLACSCSCSCLFLCGPVVGAVAAIVFRCNRCIPNLVLVHLVVPCSCAFLCSFLCILFHVLCRPCLCTRSLFLCCILCLCKHFLCYWLLCPSVLLLHCSSCSRSNLALVVLAFC